MGKTRQRAVLRARAAPPRQRAALGARAARHQQRAASQTAAASPQQRAASQAAAARPRIRARVLQLRHQRRGSGFGRPRTLRNACERSRGACIRSRWGMRGISCSRSLCCFSSSSLLSRWVGPSTGRCIPSGMRRTSPMFFACQSCSVFCTSWSTVGALPVWRRALPLARGGEMLGLFASTLYLLLQSA